MFLYETGPIDFWGGWTPIDEHLGTLDWYERDQRAHLFHFMFEALSFARDHSNWEGDIRQMHVSGLPPPHGDPTCALMIGWKQSNNGTSFIASEMELGWLAEALVLPKKEAVVRPFRP